MRPSHYLALFLMAFALPLPALERKDACEDTWVQWRNERLVPPIQSMGEHLDAAINREREHNRRVPQRVTVDEAQAIPARAQIARVLEEFEHAKNILIAHKAYLKNEPAVQQDLAESLRARQEDGNARSYCLAVLRKRLVEWVEPNFTQAADELAPRVQQRMSRWEKAKQEAYRGALQAVETRPTLEYSNDLVAYSEP